MNEINEFALGFWTAFWLAAFGLLFLTLWFIFRKITLHGWTGVIITGGGCLMWLGAIIAGVFSYDFWVPALSWLGTVLPTSFGSPIENWIGLISVVLSIVTAVTVGVLISLLILLIIFLLNFRVFWDEIRKDGRSLDIDDD